ncbi:alpha/beta fold hydrolase [Streptomyces venezuelae]|uniref:alpha/beta fold hydrolase n=1 Tax=Streptomyces venezuelae TaxID=54571 RepID=UPI0016875E80|nr:alpha/beta hydrolase [Streptomyces venezuelae]
MLLADRGTPRGGPWRQAVDHEVDGEYLRVWERPAHPAHPVHPAHPAHLTHPAQGRLALADQGRAVVLVHGFEESWKDWQALTRYLPADLRLFALDLPWRSGSRHLWADRGASTAWLERALELLPVRPDAVVAHSFGASTQLELLTRRAPGASVPTVLVAPVFRPHDQPVDARFFHEAIGRFRGVLADGLRAQLGPRAEKIPDDIVEAMIGKVRERVEPHGFLQFYVTLGRGPGLALHRIEAPVLLVSGTHDPSAPPSAIDALMASIPDVRLHQDPGLTHFCQLEQPAQVAEHVIAFLKATSPHHYAKEAISA